MFSRESTIHQQACEGIILQLKRDNEEREIAYSENTIAERLLARGGELKDAYYELYSKFGSKPQTLEEFFGILFSTAAHWSPEKIQETFTARRELINVNQQIAKKAAELAYLLEQRTDLHNTSGFISNTHSHIGDIIVEAASQNHLFHSYVRPTLEGLSHQFDLRYWPSLKDCLEIIASDAESPFLEATDSLTAVATTGRPSKSAFFKALFSAMDENGIDKYGLLPRDFRLTDRTIASLVNCALDFGVNELVDEAYLKRFRQRERNEVKGE